MPAVDLRLTLDFAGKLVRHFGGHSCEHTAMLHLMAAVSAIALALGWDDRTETPVDPLWWQMQVVHQAMTNRFADDREGLGLKIRGD